MANGSRLTPNCGEMLFRMKISCPESERGMAPRKNPMMLNMLAGGAAILAAMATRAAIKKGWRLARKSDPPLDAESLDVTWGDAVLFTALTGAAVGVARLLVVRGMASGVVKFLDAKPEEDSLKKSV